jgi:hypothetical protein
MLVLFSEMLESPNWINFSRATDDNGSSSVYRHQCLAIFDFWGLLLDGELGGAVSSQFASGIFDRLLSI